MNRRHTVTNVRVESGRLRLTVDDRPLSFSLLRVSKRLAKASDAERSVFEVSPSGYGIHWPLVDEDLSIDGLLGIRHAPKREKAIA